MSYLLEQKIKDINFNIFDTETTGNNSFRKDVPIEVAFLHYNFVSGISNQYQTMISTDLIIHPAAIMTHGITNAALDKMEKITYDEMIIKILPYFQNTVHVAHNISFDHSMLPEARDLNQPSLDTLLFARKIFSLKGLNSDNMPLTSHKMQELRYWLKLDVDTLGYDSHRALADVLVTKDVFAIMLEKFFDLTQNQDATLGELIDFINAPQLLVTCTFKKFVDQSYEEAIKHCLKNQDNYFEWLLGTLSETEEKREQNKNIIFTINHWFKEYNFDTALSGVGKNKASAKSFFSKK